MSRVFGLFWFRIDFDFHSKLVIIKQEKHNRLVVIHQTQNFDENAIDFGKKLIDVFYPEVLHLENPPLTEPLNEKIIEAATAEGNISLDDLDLFSKTNS